MLFLKGLTRTWVSSKAVKWSYFFLSKLLQVFPFRKLTSFNALIILGSNQWNSYILLIFTKKSSSFFSTHLRFCSICIFSTFHFHNPHNDLFFSLKLNLCRKEIIKLKNKKSVSIRKKEKNTENQWSQKLIIWNDQ